MINFFLKTRSLFDAFRSIEDQFKIIERIKACHHPKISPANKAKMEVSTPIDYVS